MKLFNLSFSSEKRNRELKFTPVWNNWIKLLALVLFVHLLVAVIIYGLNYSYLNIEGTYSYGIAEVTKFLIDHPISLISILFVSTILMIRWIIIQHSFPNLEKLSINSNNTDILTKWRLKEKRYSFRNIEKLTIFLTQYKMISVKMDEIIISDGDSECKLIPSRMEYLNIQLIQLISEYYNIPINQEISNSPNEFYQYANHELKFEIRNDRITIKFQGSMFNLTRDIIVFYGINIFACILFIEFLPGTLDIIALMMLPVFFIFPAYQTIMKHPIVNSWLVELNYNDINSIFSLHLPYSSIKLQSKPKFTVIQQKINVDNEEEKEKKFLEVVDINDKYILPYPITHSSNDKIIMKLNKLVNNLHN